jgi:hypothetical protein
LAEPGLSENLKPRPGLALEKRIGLVVAHDLFGDRIPFQFAAESQRV